MTAATNNRRRSDDFGWNDIGRLAEYDSLQSSNGEQTQVEFAPSDIRYNQSTSANATETPLSPPIHMHHKFNALSARRSGKRFQTKLALRLTGCSLVMLALLAACFSEWSAKDFYSFSSQIPKILIK